MTPDYTSVAVVYKNAGYDEISWYCLNITLFQLPDPKMVLTEPRSEKIPRFEWITLHTHDLYD